MMSGVMSNVTAFLLTSYEFHVRDLKSQFNKPLPRSLLIAKHILNRDQKDEK